jgi:hypothetical protein
MSFRAWRRRHREKISTAADFCLWVARMLPPSRSREDVMKVALTLLALLLGCATAQAWRDENRGEIDARRACTPDVFRLCGQYIPNREQIVACLHNNRRNLNPDCRAVFSRSGRTARQN